MKLFILYLESSRLSCLAQTAFAAFGYGVVPISGFPYAESEQLSRLTSRLPKYI